MGESILTRKGASGGGVGNYSTFVAQAQDNSKYTVYTGYDFVTNPTPNLSNNFAFNQWELNNSATGSVILSNVVVTNAGMFNGPNATFNEANIPFINSTASYSGNINNLGINNGFIYVGGLIAGTTANVIRKYNENNLTIVGNTAGFNFAIQSLAFNNGFIFAGGVILGASFVTKFHESNLVNTNTVSYGGTPYAIAINNGYVYVGGTTEETVKKYHESNLVVVNNTVSYLETIRSIAINNGFIYAGGDTRTGTNRGVTKFHEGNLALTGANLVASSTGNYGGDIRSITTNNGFIYVGGATNQTVQKYYESNLAFVGNTNNYGGTITSLTINNGFIYAGGGTNQTVQKFHEGNLVFVGNTANYGGVITSVAHNNGFIYAGGFTNQRVRRFLQTGLNPDNQTIYNITLIKE